MTGRDVVIFIFVIVIGYKGYHWRKDQQRAKAMVSALRTTAGTAQTQYGIPQSCAGKKYCMTIFIAPWCPACKSSQGSFRILQDYIPKSRPDIGFGLVIGDAPAPENKAEQIALAPIESITDDLGVIMKNRGINSYPTWIVTDSEGKEIYRQSAGFQLQSDRDAPLFLQHTIGI